MLVRPEEDFVVFDKWYAELAHFLKSWARTKFGVDLEIKGNPMFFSTSLVNGELSFLYKTMRDLDDKDEEDLAAWVDFWFVQGYSPLGFDNQQYLGFYDFNKMVYAHMERPPVGFPWKATPYNLSHEISHALCDKLDLPDTVHENERNNLREFWDESFQPTTSLNARFITLGGFYL